VKAVQRPEGSLHQLDAVALDALGAVRVLQAFAEEISVKDPKVAKSALDLILAVERFVADVATGHYLYER
jgi:hypothetical protein